MSFSINAGEIKAAVFPTGVTQLPKPSEYSTSEAGVLLCTFWVGWGMVDNSYRKAYPGLAYVAHWWHDWYPQPHIHAAYLGPLLVSQTKASAAYYKDKAGTGTFLEPNTTISYKGKTWYVSQTEEFTGGPVSEINRDGITQYIGRFETNEEAARHLLDLVYGT